MEGRADAHISSRIAQLVSLILIYGKHTVGRYYAFNVVPDNRGCGGTNHSNSLRQGPEPGPRKIGLMNPFVEIA